MPNVILQPASGVKPRKHYIDTVVNPVGFSRLARYMPVGELAPLKLSQKLTPSVRGESYLQERVNGNLSDPATPFSSPVTIITTVLRQW